LNSAEKQEKRKSFQASESPYKVALKINKGKGTVKGGEEA